MAFNQENFAPVGANSTDTPQTFSYKTSDTIAVVGAADYFFEKRFQLRAGDLIFSNIDDTAAFVYIVQADDTTVTTRIEVSNQASKFIGFHGGTFTLGTDSSDPDYLTGDGVTNIPTITFQGGKFFELWDPDTFAVKNISGKTLLVTGLISWHPVKSGGGTARIVIGSESSVDEGQNWSLNQGSNRPNEILNDGDTFQSKISFFLEWLPNQIIRFRVYNGGGGTVNFAPSSDPMLGETLTGHSVIWELSA